MAFFIPQFVYAGSSDPVADVSQATNGHLSDFWKVDGNNVILIRQVGGAFMSPYSFDRSNYTNFVLQDVGVKHSRYHVDALQRLLGH